MEKNNYCSSKEDEVLEVVKRNGISCKALISAIESGEMNHLKEKSKYPVNVIFDGDMEETIKARAKAMGMGVATYIKMLVSMDLNGEFKSIIKL